MPCGAGLACRLQTCCGHAPGWQKKSPGLRCEWQPPQGPNFCRRSPGPNPPGPGLQRVALLRGQRHGRAWKRRSSVIAEIRLYLQGNVDKVSRGVCSRDPLRLHSTWQPLQGPNFCCKWPCLSTAGLGRQGLIHALEMTPTSTAMPQQGSLTYLKTHNGQ